MEQLVALTQSGPGEPWNKGKLVGQKAPLRLREIWAIRIRLQLAERARELALFNLAVDSKLRSCDLLTLRVRDITHGDRLLATIPGSTLRKTRHSIPPFGVDVFESPLAGLFLAEVEFDDDAAMIAFSPPPWIVAEVTRDSRFTGGHLVSLRPGDLEALLLPFDLHSAAE
jgi:CYTH domain-containing protein